MSVLEVGDGFVEVIATSGDPNLGGDDFDAIVVEWLKAEFIKQHSSEISSQNVDRMVDSSDIWHKGKDMKKTGTIPSLSDLSDPYIESKLREKAEEARIALSTDLTVEISIPNLCGSYDLEPVALTRHKLESLCKPLLQKLLKPLREVAILGGVNLPGDSGEVGYMTADFTGEEPSISGDDIGFLVDGRDADSPPEEEPRAGGVDTGTEAVLDELDILRLKTKQVSGRQLAKRRKRVQGSARKELRRLQKEYGDPSITAFPTGVEANQVLLVGGATRMPMVRRLVHTVTGPRSFPH